jgi:hypothetical protein
VSLAAWLESRMPAPPPALLARVEQALAAGLGASASAAPDECVRAAVRLLEPLLEQEGAGRECALDLLAADALVTYAFEAASANVEGLDARARDAMTRLVALAPTGSHPSDLRG